MSTRQFFVGGNFKMNPGTTQQKAAIIDILNNAKLDPTTEVVIAPPALYLLPLKEKVKNGISLSAQNSYVKSTGAFTGEISPSQLADAGIPWVILGHSERRTLFHESSEFVAEKTRVALDHGLKVILCIGETLDQREAGETAKVCESQLQAVVKVLKEEDWSKIVIAYEPVWAIGTGKVASSAQAQEAHVDTRAVIAKFVSPAVASSVRIIYGGSVTAANCRELATQQDVDGFLVGGASLKPEFVDIINARQA
ncbi:TPI protein [Pluteus cervinus]|uniref:TPI protein n=1 Tax=Pluteus cervinus TaxID=181527 RepID=A0ACD3APK0_9AGAR|nr:TPI protein [Pluteus cervinus]